MALKLYLAGPDVFAPDATARFDAMRAACRAGGFEPLTPVDNELPADMDGAGLAAFIRQANVALIRRCDAVVANISPFRGPNMDPGTAWEIGFAARHWASRSSCGARRRCRWLRAYRAMAVPIPTAG